MSDLSLVPLVDATVGLRVDLLGLGDVTINSYRLPTVTVRLSDSLDDLLAKLREKIDPLWSEVRHVAAMNAISPACSDTVNGCPCYFWKKQKPPLCASCAEYRGLLAGIREGGTP